MAVVTKPTREVSTERTHSGFAAFHYRNFRLLWLGLMGVSTGTWLQGVAQDFLVVHLAGRSLDLGLINAGRAVFFVAATFFGGVLADRMDKRRLLITTHIGFALCSSALALLARGSGVRVVHVMVLSCLNAAILGVDHPTRQSLVPELVPNSVVTNAVALNSLTFTGAAAFGPAVAGPVIHRLGIAGACWMRAGLMVIMIGVLSAMRLPGQKRVAWSMGTSVAEGVRSLRGSRDLLSLFALLAIAGLFVMPYQSLVPAYALRVFHRGPAFLGFLRCAAGIGALAGGCVLAGASRFPPKGWLAVISGILFAGMVLLFAHARTLPVAFMFLLLGGLFGALCQATIQSLLQHLAHESLRGRVMSVFAVCVVALWPLGALPLTAAADRWGLTTALTTACGMAIACLFLVAFRTRGRITSWML